MSFAGIIMDVLLATLLVVALVYGFRLERRLKALRDGQAGFAAAVRELDGAARRAETGLASLRQATDEAHDSLHDRILKARELKTQLETLIARAERTSSAAPAVDAPRRTPAPAASPSSPLAARPAADPARPRDLPIASSRPAPRRFDEDLFESAGDRR